MGGWEGGRIGGWRRVVRSSECDITQCVLTGFMLCGVWSPGPVFSVLCCVYSQWAPYHVQWELHEWPPVTPSPVITPFPSLHVLVECTPLYLVTLHKQDT